jgi:hypothetical protein
VAHLATVYYKGDGVRIELPTAAPGTASLHAAPVEEIPCSAEAIEAYYCAKMAQALEGSIEDLEGFMLAFTEPGGKLLYMKLKFHWYYAAHKPDIHYSEDPNKLKAQQLNKKTGVQRVSAGDPGRDDVKTDGITIRGCGAATKGTKARGPMA